MTPQQEITNNEFAEIKFDVAKIQFNHLAMSSDGNYIESNPSTHRIAEYIIKLLNLKDSLLKQKDSRIAELSALIEQREGEAVELKQIINFKEECIKTVKERLDNFCTEYGPKF